jgi:hypothetical protein
MHEVVSDPELLIATAAWSCCCRFSATPRAPLRLRFAAGFVARCFGPLVAAASTPRWKRSQPSERSSILSASPPRAIAMAQSSKQLLTVDHIRTIDASVVGVSDALALIADAFWFCCVRYAFADKACPCVARYRVRACNRLTLALH